MAAGLALCAAFCGLETGVYVLNKARLDLRAERGWQSAKLLKAMLARPGNLLVVLLVGTNLAAYLVTFAISAMFLLSGAGRRTEWYTIAAATPLKETTKRKRSMGAGLYWRKYSLLSSADLHLVMICKALALLSK